jgi:hypothetical protein
VNRIPERKRPLVIVATGVVMLLLVAGGVLLLGQLGPSPSPTTSASPSASAPASSDSSTPEGTTRAFFDTVIAARRTDDPSVIEPLVTGTSSSAYQTVAAFLAGQKEKHKASITTQLELQDVNVTETGDSAKLTATLLESGYDISLDNGQPLESPMTLAPRKLSVDLRRTGGVWKVDSFETGASS